jgi:hypothetical protein
MTAQDARSLAERTRNRTLYSAQDAAYQKHMDVMRTKWQATVPLLAAEFRQQNGRDLSPDEQKRLLAADDMGILRSNRHLETPEFKALTSLGVPRQGEPARPGQLMAQGYELQKDGSWQKDSRDQLSGTPYLDRFIPTADGLTHKQEASPLAEQEAKAFEPRPGGGAQGDQAIGVGPGGLNRRDNTWYGPRGRHSNIGQRVPPRTLSIQQALDPGVIEKYNKAAPYNMWPVVGPDMVAKNPEAAAWLVLDGVNQINLSRHDHLTAPTFILNDSDTKKAMDAHAAWLRPDTTSPEQKAEQRTKALINEAAGGPAAQPAQAEGQNLIQAAARAPMGGAPGMVAVPGTEVAPAPAPVDPAVANWETLANAGKAVSDFMPPNLIKRGVEGIGSLAVQGARQVIPGASRVFNEPTPANPYGLQNAVPAQPPAPAVQAPNNNAPVNNLINEITPAVRVPNQAPQFYP